MVAIFVVALLALAGATFYSIVILMFILSARDLATVRGDTLKTRDYVEAIFWPITLLVSLADDLLSRKSRKEILDLSPQENLDTEQNESKAIKFGKTYKGTLFVDQNR
ncbi:hypothetical protein [Flexibacterium corallicola]|uniref:hypothetical protein n=1 Tax=Flexibacterium corallicola TaxID=3037259 RepID=UPI00286F715A|nr:hypothetical protein [Pseudovibrio sp. M1P-2-3]